MNAPPLNEKAAPLSENGNPAKGQRDIATAEGETQPHLELTKLFLRLGPRTRREFLQDVKAANPQLWREVTEGKA